MFSPASRKLRQELSAACLDIANHIVARLGFELPKNDKKELFGILAKNQIVSQALAENLTKMAGMRNILVHEYLETERGIVFKTIKNDLGDIVNFVKSISEKFNI